MITDDVYVPSCISFHYVCAFDKRTVVPFCHAPALQEQPSQKMLLRERERHLSARAAPQRQAAANVGLLWVEAVTTACAANSDKQPHEFQVFKPVAFAEWLPATYLALDETERQRAEGACFMVSQNMVDQIQRVVDAHRGDHSPLVLMGDFTFKIGCESWGVATVALTNKHVCETTFVPVSECVPLGYAWGPKECSPTWQSLLITMVEVYKKLGGMHFDNLLAAILLDGTSAGLSACKRIWPKLPVLNDTRHVQVAVRRVRHEVCSSAALKAYLSGEVHFAAGLSSRLLFHRFWTAMLIDLLLADHDKLAEYVRGHLLTWDTEARSCIYIIHMLYSIALVMVVRFPAFFGYTIHMKA